MIWQHGESFFGALSMDALSKHKQPIINARTSP